MPRTLCILLVGHDETFRKALAEALRQHGHVPLTARGTEAALAVLAFTRCDGVVLDLVTLGMEGRDFLAARSARADLAGIPVVIVSDGPQDHDLAASTWNAFMPKPVDVGEVVAAIDRLCRNRMT